VLRCCGVEFCLLPFREQGAKLITQTSTMIYRDYCGSERQRLALWLRLAGPWLAPVAVWPISSTVHKASEGLTDESRDGLRVI
jgi:hypothetical protein